MNIEVIEEPAAVLDAYGDIPITFEVTEELEVTTERGGGFRLQARPLTQSYLKDYDTIGLRPERWAERFDLSGWGFFSAVKAGQCLGRAAVARDAPILELLEGRLDLALLWDLRVAPSARRGGVGSALFHAAVAWAAARGCRQLRIETQNNNVAACRFYARQGCELLTVRRGAYPEVPDEIQLVWFKDL